MTSNAVKVLLIEDNPLDTKLILSALAKAITPFDVRCAGQLSDALACLCQQRFGVIVADLMLPDSDGLQTVAMIRRQVPNVPIVVLTALASDETALASLDQGAQDYLVKGRVTPDMLERSIRYAMQRQQNADMRALLAQVEANERLLAKKNRRLAKMYRTAHRFVDHVSHEFRTPLTVIKEYASLLRDGLVGPLNAEQCRMLDTVGDRADDLNNMVDDMLDVSRLEAGLLGVWRKSCRVADIVRYVYSSLERKAAMRGAAFEMDIDDELPNVFCDPDKIGRVIVNLAVNAIKFCGEPGSVRLWAKESAESPDVIIGVTDNGPGIDQRHLLKVFKRFKQLGSDTRRSTRGFGLGLNIAKELVALNFGEIKVDSIRGKGSTFSFSVPLADPSVVMRRYLKRRTAHRNGDAVIALFLAEIDPCTEGTLADDVNAFLNCNLRRHDLLFRRDRHSWLFVVAVEQSELHKFVGRLVEARIETNRNRPHGPLPKIELLEKGTLCVAEQSSEILGRVTELMESSASVHSPRIQGGKHDRHAESAACR